MFISRREYDLLLKESQYWQSQFEKERERADRLMDNLLQYTGVPPVSAGAVENGQKLTDARSILARQFSELLATEAADQYVPEPEPVSESE